MHNCLFLAIFVLLSLSTEYTHMYRVLQSRYQWQRHWKSCIPVVSRYLTASLQILPGSLSPIDAPSNQLHSMWGYLCNRQQAYLIGTLLILAIDACCIQDTLVQDSHVVISLINPYNPIKFHVSRGPEAAASGLAILGLIVHSCAQWGLEVRAK